MGLIYMRISPSGKYYIGLTTKKEDERWKQHAREAKAYPNSGCYRLNQAINKYGADNFTVIILEDEIQDRKTLGEREKYWIKYYDATNPEKGYNISIGGEFLGAKNKYSIDDFLTYWNKGYCIGEIKEITDVASQTVRKYLLMAGLTSEDFKQRGRERKRSKAVFQYDLAGNFIKKWEKVSQITAYYGWNNRNLYDCLNKGYSHFKNFLWKYEDDSRPIQELVDRYNFQHKKLGGGQTIRCIETNEIFPSVRDLERILNLRNGALKKIIKGKTIFSYNNLNYIKE